MNKNYTSIDVMGKDAQLRKGKRDESYGTTSSSKSKYFLSIILLVCILFTGFEVIGQTTTSYSYTGSTQTYVVPAGITSISVKVWGAGGGGSTAGPSSGGSGAFVKGTMAVTPGQTLTVVVGGGGVYAATTGGYGGGGNSGKVSTGASGGGYSGIFNTTVTQANALVIAGGGGGGGYVGNATFGGGGGATTGVNGGNRNANNVGGKGGTLLAGGAGGTTNGAGNTGSAGTALTGGTGGVNASYGGGGGGGGYFGGGGGYGSASTTNWSSGGGGGSSFLGTLTATTNTVGTTSASGAVAQAPGSAESGYVTGIGNGASSTAAVGGNGLVVITTIPTDVLPTISSFTPNTNLCINGGQTVTITGTDFTGISAVKFNGVNAASFVLVNSTTITAVSPASLSAGTITVTNGAGTATSSSYTVVANPTVTVSPTTATFCTPGGSAISLTANGASTYVWSGTGTPGLSSTSGTSVSATPVTSTTITVEGTDANGCKNTATASIGVVIAPSQITVTPAATTICSGAIQVLNATGGTNPSVSNTIGSGTAFTAATGEQTAFCNRRINYVGQTIYTAAELTAAGVTPGNITSLAYNISTNGDATTNAAFTVKIGSVGSQTTFATTAFLSNASYTTVYGPSTYTHAAPGWQTITFTTPFFWNGTDNICIDVRHDGIDSINNARTQFTTTAGNASIYGFNTPASGTLSTSRLNIQLGYTATPNTFTWSPITDLYTDSLATTSYSGSPSTTTIYAKPTSTVTYTVTSTNAANCSTSKDVTITTTNVGPQISSEPSAQTKCVGSTATFTVVATGSNLTYQWRKGTTNLTNGGTISGATTTTLTITGLVSGDSGDYNVVISSDCGSPVTSSDAALTVVTPLAGVSASATTVCSGTPVTITENGGTATSWSWSPGGATTQAITVTPTVTTNYVVTATTTVSGCTASANVTINVNATPSLVSVTPTSSTICSGSTVAVNVSGGSFTSTYFADTFDAASSQFTAATTSGTSVTTAALNTTFQSQGTGSVLFNTDGDSAEGTYSLNSNVNLTGATTAALTFSHIADMEGPTTSFDFGLVEYSSDGGATWTTFTSANYSGTASTGVFSGSDVRFSTMSYPDWISTFTGVGIQPTNALWKNETFTIPVAALTSQFRLRFRYTKDSSASYVGWFIDNVKISANGNAQYSWTATPSTTLYTDNTLSTVYNPLTDFAPTVYAQPTAQTQFTATVANGICTNSGSATVNVSALPVITLANSITVCKGTGATITIPENNNTYSWSPSTGITVLTSQSVLANPTATTIYTVTTTNTSTFCQSTNQITVNVNDPGTIVTQPSDKIVASGFSTSFTVAGSVGITYGYQWQRKTGPTTYVNLSNDANYSGVTSAVLTVDNAGTGTALDNTSYRVLLTPPSPCADIASVDAVLTVSTTGIATNPTDVNICLPTPSTAQFSVVTNGDEPYLVEWQVSTDNGATYNTISLIDVEDTFLYTGPNTTAVSGLTFEHPISIGNPNGTESEFKVLNVSGITNPATLKFKAIVNEVLLSNAATLAIANPATFTTNLSTAAITRCKNPAPVTTTDLVITVTGTVNSVQWRYDTNPGGSFANAVANNIPAGANYVASSVANTFTLAVSTDGSTPAGSYYYKAFVTGSSACGTTPVQSDMATIIVANPAVAISASSASYCTPGAAVTLTANGASTYSWTSVPSGFTSTLGSVSVTPSVATAYAVTGTDANGCTNTTTVNVGVGTSFTVATTATPTSVCPSAPVVLTALPTSAGPTTYLINTVPYQFNSVAGTFTPLSGTTVSSGLLAAEDDAMSGNLTPGSGFSFNYGGTNYTTFRVSSNGQLVFGTSGAQTTGNDLATTTATYRPGLAPLWDDLLLSSGVNYQMNGTAPNRVLTVEWLNTRWDYQAAGAVISFQVKLYETTNVIEYVYRRDATAISSGGASIGLMGTASNNFISFQDTTASPVLSTTTSKNDISTKPSNGRIYRFTPVAPTTYTYAWSSAPSGFSGTGASTTANPTVNTAYTVTATSNQGCTATNSSSVTVDSTPPVINALASTQNLCQGATATFTVTATSATPVTYQWMRNGSPLTNSSGISGATTATLTITGITPANNGSYTVAVTNCSTATSNATVLTVNPLPTAILTGTATVCQNDTQPLITFTGASGTAPYTFTYKLNGGANQTVTTTSGNSTTIAVPTTIVGSFAYTLVNVQDASSSACLQAQTGSATVTVNSLPTAPVLSTNGPICAGNALNLSTPNVLNSPNILSQNFESGLGTWAVTAASTGGTNTAVANFAIKAHGTTNSGSTPVTFNSPGGSNFIFADVDGAGSGVTLNTKLTSPSFSTVGYTTASLSFRHYHRFITTAPTVEVSTDGGTVWTSVASYTSDQGSATNFATATISLNAYIGLPNVKVRYNYTGGWLWYWAIDDISITGTPGVQTFSYAWTGPNSFSSAVQNPSIANATVAATGTYTLEITNSNGCKASSAVSAVVGAQPLWYLDADADGYYTGSAVPSCTSPGTGYTMTVTGGGDCNDAVAAINPGVAEICFNNIDDNCNSTLSEGCSPVVVNMTPSYNNSTLVSLATAIPAVPYSYGGFTNLKYRFSVTNVTTGVTAPDVIQISRYVTIPGAIHTHGATYTITASAVINEEIVPFAGNTITVFSPSVPLITLSTASCGATLATLASTLTANQALNATGYTFRIRLNDSNPTPTYGFSQSATRFVGANTFTGFPLQYGTSYKVSVQYTFTDPVSNLPVESGYGAECTVNTPSIPLTGLASPTCGSTVAALNANISATAASYATGYQFRIRLFADNGPTPTYYYTLPGTSRFSSLTAFQGVAIAYSTEYAISVQYSLSTPSGTVWSGYGPACKVTTPFFPTTSLVPSQCGLLTPTSLTQQLNITPYPGFPNYKVLLEEVVGEDVVNSEEREIVYSNFKLSDFSIAQLGKNYNISVAIKLNGVFGDYSTACDVFTPAASKTVMTVPFKATAYPNPFANNFILDVKTTSQSVVNLKVYDMIGRLIEQREVSVSDMETTTIGDRYPSGVYNVVVAQEDNVETVRVVKR